MVGGGASVKMIQQNGQNVEHYRKVPKFLDAKKLSCNLPKIQTKRPNRKGILSKWCK